MPARRSRPLAIEAERRFPVRVRIVVPAGGFGERLNRMHAWLDENCGAEGWLMMPAGLRGIVNDAVTIYFRDAALAAAFVARWCRHREPEISDGAFTVCDDEPARRMSERAHKTP